MKRTTRLKQILQRPELDFILEAHDGVSARIVEDAGFAGIWASGLALSASLGVRDNNEISWTQVIDHVEFMADASGLPILLDGDTGHGNFNNVRRFVRKLEQRGIAGVCLEDKIFPKTNSLLPGEPQPLADPYEFAGRLKAARDSQADDDFCIVARTEALVSGMPMGEAFRRAEIYREAGADAILIHSRQTTAREVLEFAQSWGDRGPVVIVPTTYYATPTDVFKRAGFSLVIWANHMLRTAITAMEKNAKTIARDESLFNVEGEIASLSRVFQLQGMDELSAANARYLRPNSQERVVILAASKDEEFGALTRERPKCMLEVNGRPLLVRQLELIRACGFYRISIVRGWQSQAIDVEGVEFVENPDYASTGVTHSLALALEQHPPGDALIASFGDIVYRKFLLQCLLDESADLAVVVDLDSRDTDASPRGDFVKLSHQEGLGGLLEEAPPRVLGASRDEPDGEMIGLLRASPVGVGWLHEAIGSLASAGRARTAKLADLIEAVVQCGHPVAAVPIHGHWVDVNELRDLVDAAEY